MNLEPLARILLVSLTLFILAAIMGAGIVAGGLTIAAIFGALF